MGVSLSTDLDDPRAIPYFLWDEPMTMAKLRARIRSSSPAESARLLGKILREARDPDVWRFITPQELNDRWDELRLHLGRRKPFWEFLLAVWRSEGLLHE